MKKIFLKKKIGISIKGDNKFLDIKLDYEMRKIYSNKKYDVTIIEILDRDNFDKYFDDDFLELEDEILLNKDDDFYSYKNSSIYMLSFPKGEEAMVSYGILKNVCEDNKDILHLCYSQYGSSGSPLLNIKNIIYYI